MRNSFGEPYDRSPSGFPAVIPSLSCLGRRTALPCGWRVEPERHIARRRSKDGFTVVELVVVVTLVAILSSLAMLSLSGATANYRLKSAVAVLERFDAQTRRYARTHRAPVSAIVAPSQRDFILDGQGYQKRFKLSGFVEIEAIKLGRQRSTDRQIQWSVNSDGVSSSYAVQLACGETKLWAVVLGFSGQVILLQDEEQVDAVLSV